MTRGINNESVMEDGGGTGNKEGKYDGNVAPDGTRCLPKGG